MAVSIGEQIGRPESKVIALMSDGSFDFTVRELVTMTRLRLPVTMIVFSNAVYGWIKAGQKMKYEQQYFSVDIIGRIMPRLPPLMG
jgi:acetolactate synthase-1/2/3 large subunit